MEKQEVDKWNSLDGKTYLIEYNDGTIKRFPLTTINNGEKEI